MSAITELEAQETEVLPLRGEYMRAQVQMLEDHLLALPKEQQVFFDTLHDLSGGIYARTIFIPAGTRLTGAIHNKDHINVVVGDITVLTEDGPQRLTGHFVLPTRAGMKRAGIAHADTIWTTLVRTDLTNIEEIEDEITPESAKLQTRRNDSCGSAALEAEQFEKLEH